jgi:hypothetical protein
MLFQRPVFLSAICVLHAAPAAVICCGVTIYLMDKERRATLCWRILLQQQTRLLAMIGVAANPVIFYVVA